MDCNIKAVISFMIIFDETKDTVILVLMQLLRKAPPMLSTAEITGLINELQNDSITVFNAEQVINNWLATVPGFKEWVRINFPSNSSVPPVRQPIGGPIIYPKPGQYSYGPTKPVKPIFNDTKQGIIAQLENFIANLPPMLEAVDIVRISDLIYKLQNNSITPLQAKQSIKDWLSSFPQLKRWIETNGPFLPMLLDSYFYSYSPTFLKPVVGGGILPPIKKQIKVSQLYVGGTYRPFGPPQLNRGLPAPTPKGHIQPVIQVNSYRYTYQPILSQGPSSIRNLPPKINPPHFTNKPIVYEYSPKITPPVSGGILPIVPPHTGFGPNNPGPPPPVFRPVVYGYSPVRLSHHATTYYYYNDTVDNSVRHILKDTLNNPNNTGLFHAPSGEAVTQGVTAATTTQSSSNIVPNSNNGMLAVFAILVLLLMKGKK